MKKAALVVYTVLFYAIGFSIQIAGTLVSLLLYPFLPQRVFNPMLTWWMIVPLALTFARFKVTYAPGFDDTRLSVYAHNHVNMLDGHLASRFLPTPFTGLMLAWHMKIPGYGWIMRLSKGIPVYPRTDASRTEKLVAAARDRVSLGLSILVFPEAHRTLDGKVRPFKTGVFVMAREAGLPVVPVAAHGWRDVGKKGSKLIHPFKRVHVWFGPQLETEGLDDDEIRALAERAHAMVSHFVDTGEPLEVAPGSGDAHAQTAGPARLSA